MKKIILPAFVLGMLFSTGSLAFAAARSPSNLSRDYVVAEESLSNWCTGFYFDDADRVVKLKKGGTAPMKSSKIMMYVGYDVFPWFTPYAVAGQNDTKFGRAPSGDSSLQYGLGALFNLLDHEVADPTLIEDRIRLTAGIEYSQTSTDYYSDELDWTALDAALTLSIVNDVTGNILFTPDSIAIFGGLIYSHWGGSDIDGASNSSDDFGFNLGLEVFYTPSVSLFASANFLENTGLTAGLNLRF